MDSQVVEIKVEPDLYFPDFDDDEDNDDSNSNNSYNKNDNDTLGGGGSCSSANGGNDIGGISNSFGDLCNLNPRDYYVTEEKGYKCTVCFKILKSSSHFMGHIRTHTGEKPWRCEICKKNFSESSSLKVHMRIHTGEKPFQCKYCMRRFTQSCNLHSHMKRHVTLKDTIQKIESKSSSMPLKCCVCEELFFDQELLKIHEDAHNRELPFKCKYCSSIFSQLSSFKIHVNRHLEFHTSNVLLKYPPIAPKNRSNTVPSNINQSTAAAAAQSLNLIKNNIHLAKVFQNLNGNFANLTQQSKLEPNGQANKFSFTSSIAPFTFPQSSQLQGSRRTIKRHECSVCKKVFGKSYNLKRHLLTHDRLKMYSPAAASVKVSITPEVDLVKMSTTPINKQSNKKITTTTPSVTRSQPPELVPIRRAPILININTDGVNATDLKLLSNQNKSTNNNLLISSVATVNQQYLLQLDKLSAVLNRKANTIATENGLTIEPVNTEKNSTNSQTDNPYQCKICNKKLSEAFSLKVHMRTHTGEKPFKCKVCNKSFSQSCNLNTHQRTHTGLKPFTCPVCLKNFTRSASLNGHIRAAHTYRSFNCNFCDVVFENEFEYKNHLLKKHRMEVLKHGIKDSSEEHNNQPKSQKLIIKTEKVDGRDNYSGTYLLMQNS